MPRGDSKEVFIRFRSKPTGEWRCDPRLRPSLVADAEANESNMTAVAVGILSARYLAAFTTNGHVRRSRPRGDGNEMLLSIPTRLYRAIDVARARAGRSSVQDEIIFTLSDHYGLVT